MKKSLLNSWRTIKMRNKYLLSSDEILMSLLNKGDAKAFDELYNRYSKKLLNYFARMLAYDSEYSQDALQDLFLKVIEKSSSFDPEKKFKTWIYTIAYNMCKNEYKHLEVVNVAEREIAYHDKKTDNSLFQSVSSKLDARGFNNALIEILKRLPFDKKTTFLLRYQEDKSIEEIAEILDCAEGTIKSRLHYTLKLLAEQLSIFNPQN